MSNPSTTPGVWRVVSYCKACKLVMPDLDYVCLKCGADCHAPVLARPHRPRLIAVILSLLTGRGKPSTRWEIRS